MSIPKPSSTLITYGFVGLESLENKGGGGGISVLDSGSCAHPQS